MTVPHDRPKRSDSEPLTLGIDRSGASSVKLFCFGPSFDLDTQAASSNCAIHRRTRAWVERTFGLLGRRELLEEWNRSEFDR